MIFAEHVKKKLLALLSEMASEPGRFTKHPETNFTRKRKLDFETTVRCILLMERGSIRKELLNFFKFDSETPSASALCQQRSKLLPDVFQHLFHEFNSCFKNTKTYRGYHLIACDGSALNISRNPKDADTYFITPSMEQGYNQLHLNTLYDLCSKRCVDVLIQEGHKRNECLAMTQMIERYQGDSKTIFIADRGYEMYNIFAHASEKSMYYLIRVKDGSRGGIVSGLKLPGQMELDQSIHLILTRKKTKEVQENREIYKKIDLTNTFDYLDSGKQFYPMDFRVVRFKITENTWECVITNLPGKEFPLKEIKKLYAMRWGIETSYRELKYDIGLNYFHSKKVEYIKQEIHARLILYNFCEIITGNVTIHQKDTRYRYQINYTIAIHICRKFLNQEISPPEVEKLIQKNLLPIRPGRSHPRKVKRQAVVSFLYR